MSSAKIALGQQIVPVGAEFQVNAYTRSFQHSPSVALSGGGDFLVVWQSYLQDGAYNGVFARSFTGSSAVGGDEFQVNSHTAGEQLRPRAAGGDAGLVVAWGGDPVSGRRLDPSGDPLSVEFQIDASTVAGVQFVDVATDSTGGFVASWDQTGGGFASEILARLLDADGLPVGDVIQVNSYTVGAQHFPEVANGPDGSFVVAWVDLDRDASGLGVFGQIFDGSGSPLGGDFQINSHTSGDQALGDVTITEDGSIVVVWHSRDQDGSLFGIFSRRFDPSGAALTPERQVNLHTFADQESPQVACDRTGRCVVVWSSAGDQDGSQTGVFARVLDPAGTPTGGEVQINQYSEGSQLNTSLAMGADGRFVVAWTSEEQDGSAHGVFARHFRLTGPEPPFYQVPTLSGAGLAALAALVAVAGVLLRRSAN